MDLSKLQELEKNVEGGFQGVQGKVGEAIDRIKDDPELQAKFKENPVGAIEGVLGVDLPDEQVNAAIAGMKEKIDFDAIGDNVAGVLDKIKNMFAK